MKIDYPLAILDLETTGISVAKDRIVEIAILRGNPDETWVQYETVVNPRMEIPPGATKVHGITNDEVQRAPYFSDIAPEVLDIIRWCDLAGYNIVSFDLPLLTKEFERSEIPFGKDDYGIVFDALTLFRKEEPHTLERAVSFYTGRSHDDAHAAMDDVRATWEVVKGQATRYLGGNANLRELEDLCHKGMVSRSGKMKYENGVAVLTFGKYSGVSLDEVVKQDSGYLHWLINKNVIDDQTERKLIMTALESR